MSSVVVPFVDTLGICSVLIVRSPCTARLNPGSAQIAGGSGLTPMLQIAYALAKDPTIKTDTTLIYANTSVGDIMLKDVLDGMAEKHSNFHVHHVVSRVCFVLCVAAVSLIYLVGRLGLDI